MFEPLDHFHLRNRGRFNAFSSMWPSQIRVELGAAIMDNVESKEQVEGCAIGPPVRKLFDGFVVVVSNGY